MHSIDLKTIFGDYIPVAVLDKHLFLSEGFCLCLTILATVTSHISIYMNDTKRKLTVQEKIRKGLIKTPIKRLNKHFMISYIFKEPTKEEMEYMQSKVMNALTSKGKQNKDGK
jgi:hypothetical protein